MYMMTGILNNSFLGYESYKKKGTWKQKKKNR